MRLPSGSALIIAKEKAKLGDLSWQNHAVYRLVSSEVIQFQEGPASDARLSPVQRRENAAFISMLQQTLDTTHFYFSYSCDLTQSMQRRYDQGLEYSTVSSLFTSWDERFVWNRALLERFLLLGLDYLRFCVPLIHGAVFIRQCSVNGKLFRWTLISRRSARRAGTRYTLRGCDEQGNVANYVETEQLVESGGVESAFVQTRGSIPLFWKQAPTTVAVYKPDPELVQGGPHLEGFINHFTEQIGIYGEQVMLNLIDQRRAEGKLEKHTSSIASTAGLAGFEYKAFDFHKECSQLKYDRLHGLINDLRPSLDKHSYFLCHTSQSVGGVTKKQRGVVRTNCMDCLDRTNVVQSLIALEHLQSALTFLGILKEGQLITENTTFMSIYNNIWADHADLLSIQYAGTGALKTDFTRTGKRTVQGLWLDLQNSLVRYFKNNLMDGERQDAIDLFLGVYRVEQNPVGESYYATAKPSSLSWTGSLSSSQSAAQFLPVAILLTLALFSLSLVSSLDYENGLLFFLLFWGCVAGLLVGLCQKFGHGLVDRPKLVKRTDGVRKFY